MTDTKKLRDDILDLLKSKKLYEKTDLNLIEELCYQYELLDQGKKDIKDRGLNVNVREFGEPYYNTNPSVNVVKNCTRTIQSLYRQLAIAPQDRIRIQVEAEDKEAFDINQFVTNTPTTKSTRTRKK